MFKIYSFTIPLWYHMEMKKNIKLDFLIFNNNQAQRSKKVIKLKNKLTQQ